MFARFTDQARASMVLAQEVAGRLGHPWLGTEHLLLGLPSSVRVAIDHLVGAGRARTDDRGRVTAAAGLSTEPTSHHVLVGFDSRWTNCAYNALGILGEENSPTEL